MIHETAQIHSSAQLGINVNVWNWVQIRENVSIGENSIISKSVYIDFGVSIGKNVKIQNNVSIYHGVIIEDGVFIGPHVCFTNDKRPRAINADGSIKGSDDWDVLETRIKYGCSIGANATITPGICVGKFAMVGAGAVVTKNVPDYGLVQGNPAKLGGYVCPCGSTLSDENIDKKYLTCKKCNFILHV